MLRLLVNGIDVINLAPTVTWSGDYLQCARTLEFGAVTSPTDQRIPIINCPLGAAVQLLQDNTLLFDGFAFGRDKATNSSVMDITCFDRGIYVKRNEKSYKFKNSTPEAATKRICADFGIPIGDIVSTGYSLTRNFPQAKLYDIIQTAYTLASEKTKKKYQVGFRGAKLCVWEKSAIMNAPQIAAGVNLMDAATSESIQNMVNQVAIYDKNDNLVKTVKNAELVKLYGAMQSAIKQADGEDTAAKAQKLMDDNGVEQKITVNCLGDVRYITGTSVVVQEPYTGLKGLFYIDSDTHSWKNGVYTNKLVLNFRAMMDEKQSGSA